MPTFVYIYFFSENSQIMIQVIFFTVVTILAFGYAGLQFSKLRRNILLGKDEKLDLNLAQSWKNVFLVAFGQQKCLNAGCQR